MYSDIFLSNPQVTFEPGPDGVVVTMPGNKTGIVYAVSEREKGFLHCLVTDDQLTQLDEDNFPYRTFDVALSRYKKDNRGPNHVFNPAGCTYTRRDKRYIHKIGASAEKELNPAVEIAAVRSVR